MKDVQAPTNGGRTPCGHAVRAARRNGMKTTRDFAEVFSGLAIDVLEGTVSANDANAASNAGERALHAIELQCRFGRKSGKLIDISAQPDAALNEGR